MESTMTSLEVTVGRPEEGRALVGLRGELDVSTAPKVETALRQVEEQGVPLMVIDLRGLTFLDSSGLRLILEADGRARREHRRLLVVQGPPEVQRVFRVTLTDSRLEFTEDPAVIPATDGGTNA
jgi:anti-sigma B factor antagonist